MNKEEKERQLKEYYKQIDSGELIQLNTRTASKLRKKYWLLQNKKCPVLNQRVNFEDTTCDHKHRKQEDPYGGEYWLGLVRGILHKQANSWEGKCYNSFIKMGLHKFITFPEALRNLAEYLDNPSIDYGFIYPSEAPKNKRKKLKKREYNKVIKNYKKVYPRRKKYPSESKYLTKVWEKMIKDTNEYLKKQQKNKAKRRRKK